MNEFQYNPIYSPPSNPETGTTTSANTAGVWPITPFPADHERRWKLFAAALKLFRESEDMDLCLDDDQEEIEAAAEMCVNQAWAILKRVEKITG